MREFARRYLQIIESKFPNLNLTRILSEEDFYQKQVLDSLLPIKHLSGLKEELNKTKLLVDVGFGGGLPLLPLAYTFPKVRFLGIEARAKKARAVQEIARLLELSNVRTWHRRLENISFDRKCLLTFKAVGTVKDCLQKINGTAPLTALFYKARNFEKLEGDNCAAPGWNLQEKAWASLPNNDARLLLLYRSQNHSRKLETVKKNIANLSAAIEQYF